MNLAIESLSPYRITFILMDKAQILLTYLNVAHKFVLIG